MAKAPALSTKHLTKQYLGTSTQALADLTLSVSSGEVYGFLGANGAGKSTTIKTILNFLQPTSGSATIAGYDSVAEAVTAKRHVGYLAGEVELYGKATAKEFFAFMAELQPPKNPDYLNLLVKRFDVTLDQRIETLSKGNRQKVGLVQAFMHEPDVLILDEPTSGLDPLMQEEFFKLIDETKQRGAAIFLSSHNLAEAQRICDRIGIIKHGRLIREQTMTDDTNLTTPTFRVQLVQAKDAAKLRQARDLVVVSGLGAKTLLVQPKTTLSAALSTLSTVPLAGFTTERLDLEDEFLKFYEDGQ